MYHDRHIEVYKRRESIKIILDSNNAACISNSQKLYQNLMGLH